MAVVKEFLMGKEGQVLKVPNKMQKNEIYDKDQLDTQKYLLEKGKSNLENPYAGFDPIRQQAVNQFNQKTVPGIAERFTSMGNNSLSSPSFASQLGESGAGLNSALAAMQAEYGQRNQNTGMQQLQYGLNPRHQFSPQYQNFIQDAQSGALGPILQSLMSAGGSILGGMLGGPPGAIAGGAVGSAAGSGLGSMFNSSQNKLSQQFGLSDDYFNLGQRDFTGQKQYYANPGSSGSGYGNQFGLNSGYLNL